MRRYLVLIASLAVLAGGAQGALAQDAPTDTDRIQSLVQPSIVFLKTTFAASVRDTNPRFREILFNGDPVETSGRCTGFFVNPEGYVATAAHCILVDDLAKQWIIDQAGVQAFEDGQFGEGATVEDAIDYARDWFRIAGKVSTGYLVAYPTTSATISSEETTEARRVGYRIYEEGDIGLLKFETRGIQMPGLELAESTEVRVGTPIVAVGFPGNVDEVTDEDYNPSFKDGKISSLKTIGGGQVGLYEHDASVSGGMSGGPVVDSDGRVIGVTSRGASAAAEGFDFAAPVAVLQEVLGDKDVENEIGDVGEIYREGVEALYDENRSTALDRFDEVLKNPGNPAVALAASLRPRAEALPEDEGFPWLVALIVLAVLVLAAAGAVFLLRRRGAFGEPAIAGVPSGASGAPAGTQAPPGPAPTPPAAAATATGDAKPALVLVGPRGETAVRHQLEGEMVIGREAADILLSDEQVSRRHAQIRVADDRLELTDLGSANGTEVNGQRITTSTVTLGHGDTIKVGNTELRVELPPSMRGPRPSGATVIAPRSDS